MLYRITGFMRRFAITYVAIVIVLGLLTMAAGLYQQLTPGTVETIAFIVATLVGLFGPKPMQVIVDLLHFKGQAAVFVTWVVALLVGVGALALSSQLFSIPFTTENILAIGGLLFAAATYAFHRLKDIEAAKLNSPPSV